MIVFFLFWCFFGIVIYIGYGAYGFGVDAYVVLWIVIFLGSGWGVFSSFRRALKPSRKEPDKASDPSPPTKPSAPVIESNHAEVTGDFVMEQANEKLAALLQKPKDNQ